MVRLKWWNILKLPLQTSLRVLRSCDESAVLSLLQYFSMLRFFPMTSLSTRTARSALGMLVALLGVRIEAHGPIRLLATHARSSAFPPPKLLI